MAEAEEMEQTEQQAEEGGGPPKPSILPVLITGIAMTLVGAGVMFAVGMMVMRPPKVEAPDGTEKVPILFEFETDIKVNVKGTRWSGILQFKPILVCDTQKMHDEMKKFKPKVEDNISGVAGDIDFTQLEGPNGREILKTRIKDSVNNLMKDRMAGAVLDVYLNDFIISK